MQIVRKTAVGVAIACALAGLAATWGMVSIEQQGKWPKDWPRELDAFRSHAQTLEVANGTQENIYEIRFTDRQSFEKAWPAILSIKTPGAPLRLATVDLTAKAKTGLLLNDGPMVRIYAPSEGDAVGKNGTLLHAGAPWPKELYGPHGELPEWVMAQSVGEIFTWVPVGQPGSGPPGFYNRARVEIELVIDGNIIDLNRIKLPPDTPIADARF